MTSNELLIGVFDPDKAMLLTLNLTSDRTSVPQVPGQVQFALTVTNNSNITINTIIGCITLFGTCRSSYNAFSVDVMESKTCFAANERNVSIAIFTVCFIIFF